MLFGEELPSEAIFFFHSSPEIEVPEFLTFVRDQRSRLLWGFLGNPKGQDWVKTRVWGRCRLISCNLFGSDWEAARMAAWHACVHGFHLNFGKLKQARCSASTWWPFFVLVDVLGKLV